MYRKSDSILALIALLFGLLPLPTYGSESHCPGSPDLINIDQSLIVHSPYFFTKGDFSFARTIDSIIASLKMDPAANRIGLVQSMLDSYKIDQKANPDSMLPMSMATQLDKNIPTAAGLLDEKSGLHPVALVNRLDRAPSDVLNCGEYRIVYALGLPKVTPRFLLIFEAVLANPKPNEGIAGCLPVAEFWSDLSGKSVDEMMADLEKFYYRGLGSGFPAVVEAQNFGIPDGQIRGNTLLDGSEDWQLREWKIKPSFGRDGAAFRVDTVKNSPLVEFYADNSSGAIDPLAQEQERIAYQKGFIDRYLPMLLDRDLTLPPVAEGDIPAFDAYKMILLNEFAEIIDNRFNEFQSISSHYEDDPASVAKRIKADIDAALPSLNLPPDRRVTYDHVLARAGAITCGGCHEFSNSKVIGKVAGRDILWPNSRGFVHINEEGKISPALTDWFLPYRRQKLYEVLCDEPKQPDSSSSVELGMRKELAGLLAEMIDGKLPLNGRESEANFNLLVEKLTEIDLRKKGYFVPYRRTH